MTFGHVWMFCAYVMLMDLATGAWLTEPRRPPLPR